MYTKPAFAPANRDAVFDLIDQIVTGTLITPHEGGLAITHLAFLADRSRGDHGTLISHLARNNQHAALIEAGRQSAVVFAGPHAYISSSWYPGYPRRDNAPTWNYVAVHCHGPLVPYDDPRTARHLAELVSYLERGRARPWQLRELGADGMRRRLPHILGFEMPVARLDAKFKLGQDEPWADTQAAIAALAAEGRDDVVSLMLAYNEGREEEAPACPARPPSAARAPCPASTKS